MKTPSHTAVLNVPSDLAAEVRATAEREHRPRWTCCATRWRATWSAVVGSERPPKRQRRPARSCYRTTTAPHQPSTARPFAKKSRLDLHPHAPVGYWTARGFC